eukprot:jgi/Tetstr1/443361/TSEL_031376.t1
MACFTAAPVTVRGATSPAPLRAAGSPRPTPAGDLPRQGRRAVAARANASSPGPSGAFDEATKGEARQKLFNEIAPVYDQLNNMLSLGQHHIWKRMAVKWADARPGTTCLDICCGSGDIAFLLAQAAGPTGKVVGLDFAQNMLDDAAQRQAARPPTPRVCNRMSWVQGDAMAMPFDDACFDAATMGYGLRNVSDIPAALSELERVLRPGGKAAILDFNNADDDSVADTVQGWALENVVVPAADFYGLRDEYAYLRPSIKNFPSGRKQEELALAAGFAAAKHYEISFGLMGILVVTKRA